MSSGDMHSVGKALRCVCVCVMDASREGVWVKGRECQLLAGGLRRTGAKRPNEGPVRA